MINILLDYAHILEMKRGEPQPRRHKCLACGRVFVCDKCTKTMWKSSEVSKDGLHCFSCSQKNSANRPQYDVGFLCANCQ